MCARDREGAPGIDDSFNLVVDKGCHSRGVLQALPDSCRNQISEPKHKEQLLWKSDMEARELWPAEILQGQALLRGRGEKEARSFAHCLDRDGMRRTPSGGLSIERSAPSSMSPGSIWGYCGGPCLVLAQQKAGPLLKPG